REMPRPVDVTLVPLRLFPDVEDLDGALGEEGVELLDLDWLELLARLRLGQVATKLEEGDRPQASRGLFGVLCRRRVNRQRIVDEAFELMPAPQREPATWPG